MVHVDLKVDSSLRLTVAGGPSIKHLIRGQFSAYRMGTFGPKHLIYSMSTYWCLDPLGSTRVLHRFEAPDEVEKHTCNDAGANPHVLRGRCRSRNL